MIQMFIDFQTPSLNQYVLSAHHCEYHQCSPEFGPHLLGERSLNWELKDRDLFQIVAVLHMSNEELRSKDQSALRWPDP